MNPIGFFISENIKIIFSNETSEKKNNQQKANALYFHLISFTANSAKAPKLPSSRRKETYNLNWVFP